MAQINPLEDKLVLFPPPQDVFSNRAWVKERIPRIEKKLYKTLGIASWMMHLTWRSEDPILRSPNKDGAGGQYGTGSMGPLKPTWLSALHFYFKGTFTLTIRSKSADLPLEVSLILPWILTVNDP